MSKGRKPKIPHSKKVRTLIDELKRRRGERDLQQRFLIVCEDEKSAPNYFKALEEAFRPFGNVRRGREQRRRNTARSDRAASQRTPSPRGQTKQRHCAL